MRDSDYASSSFLSAIEQDPNYYDAYIRLGILYSKLPKKNKNRALAYDYFNSAIEIRPDFIEGHYDKAMFCQENDMVDEALEEYEKIIAIDPKFESAWHNKGYVYLIYKENYKLAIEFFTKAINIKPTYVGAYHNRALAWLKLGDIQRAKSDFNAALAIDPQYDKSAIELDNIDKGKIN
jgi:tetratricopeptide (TPR) repeat protein